MASIKIGSRGFANADIIIPQATSLQFEIIHKDAQGNPIDHRNSKLNFAFQGAKTYDLSEYCEATETSIVVSIPASASAKLPIGRMIYDFIVVTNSYSICLLYGDVTISDTVSLDVVK